MAIKKPKKNPEENIPTDCPKKIMAVRDAMDVLSGKWKVFILSVLIYRGKMRFMDMIRVVDGIAAKMLSKELQDLELNKLVKRTVCPTKPITVEYEITNYGKSLEKMINEITDWGMLHRKKILNK